MFPSEYGPCGHDICLLMGEAIMMSHGDLLLSFLTNQGVEAKGGPVSCAAVRQKTEAWQESFPKPSISPGPRSNSRKLCPPYIPQCYLFLNKGVQRLSIT